jgi:D-hydroxyproline dehydrogenase subunit gamma
MFRRQPDAATNLVSFSFDGRAMSARPGDTVAAALLANDVSACRSTTVTGAQRGPYCMMGVCFECLVTIDGAGNRQACMVRVQSGMQVETQRGKRMIER